MATIAIFGGTGYAGTPGFISRAGNLHDPALVDHTAVEADVIVVAIRAGQQDGVRLADSITTLAKAAAEHSTRLGFVGGAGSLHVTEGGPRVVDLPAFPDAHKGEALGQADVLAALRETTADADADGNSNISGAVYAQAFVDEIETPEHRRQRFTVAY